MPLPSKLIIYCKIHEQRQRLGQNARQRILEGGYDLQNALKQQMQLLNQVVRG